jgi:class 3 adenylate cyclase
LFDEISVLEIFQQMTTGERPNLPLQNLLGVRFLDVREGSVVVGLEVSDWLAVVTPHVAPGVIASFSWRASAGAMGTLAPVGHRLAVLGQTVTFLSPVPTDVRELVGRGRVTHRRGEILLSTVDVTDAEGNVMAAGHQTSLQRPSRQRAQLGPEPQRVLATVLFTDIVGSTQRVQEMGDARWKGLLEEHHSIVRKQLQVFKGREVKTTGDGFLATFDSPGRGVQCARAIRDSVRGLGLEVRAGLHTGECEVSGTDVAGIAIHVASRIQAAARPGEILVSGTVHDLVAGSGLQLSDRGIQALKGLEGKWQLFAADS